MKILIILFFFTSIAFAQISPGDLTKAHANLEGLSKCTKCHELGEKVLNSKCLDCHSEIKTFINSGSGYHSSSEVKGKECGSCHPEHFGRNFKIVNFNPDDFDHDKTGYILTGSHIKTKCKECHQAKNISDPEIQKRKGTYLGLNSNCFSCHNDHHQGMLGDNCSNCHNTEKFKHAANFDHQNAKFKLTGKHTYVDCLKCHPVRKKNGEDYQVFVGLDFANCTPCHNDVHKGRFGKDCKNCHVTTGFNIINKARFNHDDTNFPLIGKHRFVDCNKCHKTNLKAKLKFAKCTDCHSDYHDKQFMDYNQVQNCSDCHDEYGFEKAQFSIDQHNKTEFRLTGAHLAVACQACHLIGEKWLFKKVGLECISCHKNIHGNEIEKKYMGNNNCTGCHSIESWSTIFFEHKRTGFELLGKHKEQTCRKCHEDTKTGTGENLIFRSTKSNCEYCHNDVHEGQFKEGELSDCTRCHTCEDWKPEKFDHEKTSFSLKGAHEKLKCVRCHPVIDKGIKRIVKYKLEDFKCAACHS